MAGIRQWGWVVMMCCWMGGVFGCRGQPPAVAKLPPPPVTVAVPLQRTVTDQEQFEGRIAAVETIDIRARVRGHLTKVHFEDGQLVKQDQLLFEIDSRPYQASLDSAQAQLAGALAELKLATAELKRYRYLLEKKAASQQDVDIWEARESAAVATKLKAEAAREQAQLDLDFCKVSAPQPGRIGRAQVSIGNLINAANGEMLLTTIVSVDPMYVYFNVDERTLLAVRRNRRTSGPLPATLKELKIPIQVALDGETGFPHTGVIDFADNKLNPSTGTILVRGRLSNENRDFEDGLRARVRVPNEKPYEALLIPEAAVGADQDRKFVYVVDVKNIAHRREVTLGRVQEGLQVVLQGLTPADLIVINGMQRVRDGLEVTPREGTVSGGPGLASSSAQPDEKSPAEPSRPAASP